MEQNEFFQSIENGNMQSCYCFVGEEDYVKERALNRLVSAAIGDCVDEFNYVILDKNATEEEIINACSTFPMMGGRKIVLLRDPLILSKKSGNMPAANLGNFINEQLDVSILAILLSSDFDVASSSKLYTVIKKTKGFVEFKYLSEDEKKRWIKRELKIVSVTIDNDALDYFLQFSQDDLNSIHNETEKLISFAGEDGNIAKADVEELISRSVEYNIFKLFDCIMQKKADEAVELIKGLIADGEEEIAILGLLAKNYHQLYMSKKLKARGVLSGEIAKKIGVKDFVVKLLEKNGSKISLDEVEQAIFLLKKTDASLKRDTSEKSETLIKAVIKLSV